jgi:hypothetical protein
LNHSVFDAKHLTGRKFEDADFSSRIKALPFQGIQQEWEPQIRVEYRGEEKEFVRGRFFIFRSY